MIVCDLFVKFLFVLFINVLHLAHNLLSDGIEEPTATFVLGHKRKLVLDSVLAVRLLHRLKVSRIPKWLINAIFLSFMVVVMVVTFETLVWLVSLLFGEYHVLEVIGLV